MKNPALQEKFGRAGRKRAEEKFSWLAIAQQTQALYEKVRRELA
jgi:glycosyltransferase involved in cell wall biosynthesis